MPTSYLIVTKWKGDTIINSLDEVTWKLVRQVQAQGEKARKLARQYAQELNNGIDYTASTGINNLINALNNDTEYYTVVSIPANQAREYNNYLSWENCDTYIPK